MTDESPRQHMSTTPRPTVRTSPATGAAAEPVAPHDRLSGMSLDGDRDQPPLSVAEVQSSLAHQVSLMSGILQTVVRTQQDMTTELRRIALTLEQVQEASSTDVKKLLHDVAALSAVMNRSGLTAPALSSHAAGNNDSRAVALVADTNAGPVAVRTSEHLPVGVVPATLKAAAIGKSAPVSLVSFTPKSLPSSSSSSSSLLASLPTAVAAAAATTIVTPTTTIAAPFLDATDALPTTTAMETTKTTPRTTGLKIMSPAKRGEELGISPVQREEVDPKKTVPPPEDINAFLAKHATIVRDPHIVRSVHATQSSKVKLLAVDDMKALEAACGFVMDFPHEVVEAMYESAGKMPNTFPKDRLTQTHFWVIPPDGALTGEEWKAFNLYVDNNVLVSDLPYNLRGIGVIAFAERKSHLNRFAVAALVNKEVCVVPADHLYHLFGVYTIQQERVEQILREAQRQKLSRQEVYGRLQLFIKTTTPAGLVFLLPLLPVRVLAYMVVSRNNPRVSKFRRGHTQLQAVVKKRHILGDEVEEMDDESDEVLSGGRQKRRPTAGAQTEQLVVASQSLTGTPKAKRAVNGTDGDVIRTHPGDGDINIRSTLTPADLNGEHDNLEAVREPATTPQVHAPPSPDMLVLSLIEPKQAYDEFGMLL